MTDLAAHDYSNLLELHMETNSVSYRGILVSLEMFEFFADRANDGTLFRIVKALPSGAVMVERVPLGWMRRASSRVRAFQRAWRIT